MKAFYFFVCWGVLLGHCAWGQEPAGSLLSSDFLMPQQVDNLFGGKVSTASKSDERITDAPAIISVITDTEIALMGAQNLPEILERVVSVYAIGSFFIPHNIISIRGDVATPYNNHVLILLNGRPVRENLFGGIDHPILLAFPVQSIQKIEVIRGPGSVLYGTNAFAGVVNIITKTFITEENDITLQYGSFGSIGVDYSSTKIREDFRLSTGVKYFQQNGWELNTTGQNGRPISYESGQQNFGTSVFAEYKKLTINALLTYSRLDNTGVLPLDTLSPFVPSRNRSITTLRSFIDVGYTFNFSEKADLSLNATYNAMQTRFDNPSGAFVGNTGDVLLEATQFLRPSAKVKMLFGATAYLQGGRAEIGDDPDRGVSEYAEVWYSGYAQVEYSPHRMIKLIAGAQANKPDDIDLSIVPRLGLIANFTDYLGIKALYGSAFRAPFAFESGLRDAPILFGNPRLNPETVTSYEGQIFLNRDRLRLMLTVFRNEQRDLIVQRGVIDLGDGNRALSYVNESRLDAQGFEAEFKLIPLDNFYITGSYAYQTSERDGDKDRPPLLPQHMAKLGGFYQSPAGISLGVFHTFFSQAGSPPDALALNPPAEAFHGLNARLRVRLNGKNNSRMRMMWGIYATNLLDARVYYPEFVYGIMNTYPGRAGRAFYTTLSFQF
ncbi:MAG: TonB-dependent receptor plug domain-containing protein [Bernardetiaceae bacterium]